MSHVIFSLQQIDSSNYSWPKANREEQEPKETYRNEGFRFNGGFNEEKESASVPLTDCESRLSSSSLSGGTTGAGRGKGAEQSRGEAEAEGLFSSSSLGSRLLRRRRTNERKNERTREQIGVPSLRPSILSRTSFPGINHKARGPFASWKDREAHLIFFLRCLCLREALKPREAKDRPRRTEMHPRGGEGRAGGRGWRVHF